MRNIMADGHDEDAWRAALARSPALRKVRDEGAERFEGFGDLLADLYHLVRQPIPRWTPAPRPSVHGRVLRDLAALPEFREMRALAVGDQDNAALATCILGRKLAQKLEAALVEHLDAEAKAADLLAAATTLGSVADDLATSIGDGHPAVAEARATAAGADAEAAAATARLADAATTTVDDLLAAFRREARGGLREVSAAMTEVAEAASAVGGGSAGGLADKLALAEKLAGSRKFGDLVAIAGRVKRIALDCRASVVKDVPPEIVGVTTGRDLQRVLPADRALLALPATRFLFMKKLVEGQLLVQEQRGEERLGHGPIVLCLDGSGSMAGPREVWSKAVALGYLAIATRERRDVIIGQFGAIGEIEVREFPLGTRPELVRQEAVIEAMERFLNAGSTDLEGALRWAVAQVGARRGYAAADVVVLTDAEAALSPGFLAAWHEARSDLRFRSYGVLIGEAAGALHLGQAIQHVVPLPDLADDGPALAALFGRK